MPVANKFNTLGALETLINNGKAETAFRQINTIPNWNLVRDNPNYRAVYNRIANKLVAKGYTTVRRVYTKPENIKSRQQQGGTCWFHGIINGLLMSQRPRQLLQRMVAGMNLGPDNANNTACPARTASAAWFWKYIRHRLSGGGNVSSVFRNKNVIKSVGLRRVTMRPSGFIPRVQNTLSSWRGRIMASRSGVTGGTAEDLINLYQKLFPENFSSLFIIKPFGNFQSTINPYVPHTMERNGTRYTLSHAWIHFNVRPFMGHVVTGYKTKYGTFRVYDSGTNTVYQRYDWTVRARVSPLLKMYDESLPFPLKTRGMKIWAVYMKS